jgi:hypothetical protein
MHPQGCLLPQLVAATIAKVTMGSKQQLAKFTVGLANFGPKVPHSEILIQP